MPVRIFEKKAGIIDKCVPLCDEDLKVVLKCIGTTQIIRCRDHMNIAHTSVRTGFWTYVN
jgi:hypothetical protein